MTAIVERRMQETLVHGSDWLAFIETQTHDVTANSGVAGASPQLLERERDPEAWAKTDRPLRMPLRRRSSAPFWNSPTNDEQSAVARWLKEHGVHTEFVDAGIGCCWFAYMGDDEPFCGETEEAALEKLARANGVELPVLQS